MTGVVVAKDGNKTVVPKKMKSSSHKKTGVPLLEPGPPALMDHLHNQLIMETIDIFVLPPMVLLNHFIQEEMI